MKQKSGAHITYYNQFTDLLNRYDMATRYILYGFFVSAAGRARHQISLGPAHDAREVHTGNKDNKVSRGYLRE